MKRILNLTSEERSPYLDSTLGAISAFIAGGINAGGFMVIGRHTSHVTGIVSESAQLIVNQNWHPTLQIVGLLLSFGSGAAFASYMIHVARYLRFKSPFALALMSSGSVMIFVGLWTIHYGIQHPHEILLEFGLFFAMGIQNATVTQLSHNQVRATHMTGILTDLGIELGNGLFSRKKIQKAKLQLASLILFSFVTGGILGVWLFQDRMGMNALLFYGGLLFTLAALPIVIPPLMTTIRKRINNDLPPK
jgi:uncharacterized membrane protein YoaK (UPF0700 family)